MIAVRYLAKLWIILLIIGIGYFIWLIYKSWNYPPPDYKVEGIEVAPNTIFCVSAMALVDGGCKNRKALDCESLIRSYEASCFHEDSPQMEDSRNRSREWHKSFLEKK